MAARPTRLTVAASLGFGLLILARPAAAQPELSLAEAAARKPGNYAPLHAGQQVKLRGVVSMKAVPFLQYTQLPIQQDNHGFVLQGRYTAFAGLEPGDQIEAIGEISLFGGLAILAPSEIRKLGHTTPPTPQPVRYEDLQGFRYLGRLVTTEARIVDMGETTGGVFLLIGTAKNLYKIFVPYSPQDSSATFAGLEVGDKVRATGFSSQYCPSAPYNRWFEMVLPQTGDVVQLNKGWPIPPSVLAGILVAAVLIGIIWWTREQRLRAQREMLRRAYELGEEVLGAASSDEILQRVQSVAPRILSVSGAQLYLHNRATRTLECLGSAPGAEPDSISLAAPSGVTGCCAVLCFQNRMLLVVPDTSRSPFAGSGASPGEPKSLLFVPMFAQGEVIGVFELNQHGRARDFGQDEQTLAQHLGNQIGAAIKLLDQRSVREQLFRTEKLAAVGRLISGVVNDLQAPLASIASLAETALSNPEQNRPARELRAIYDESQRASELVGRLVCFENPEQVQAKTIELNQLLRNLIEFREREWKSRGIRVRDLTRTGPLPVLGSQGQLEQVFLNLLVHAEQSLADAQEKVIVVRTSLLAKRILVEITFTGPRDDSDPFARWTEEAGSIGLDLCRSILAGHGGEIRLVRASGADPRFEIELPLAQPERSLIPAPQAVERDPEQILTALVIEPEEPIERQLLTLLAARGYRVIPVQNSDVGLDLMQRLRFDVAFCSVRAPGLNWVELSEQVQPRITGFVLLSDGYDAELAADFGGEGRFVLPKPIEENQLDAVLEAIESAPRPHVSLA